MIYLRGDGFAGGTRRAGSTFFAGLCRAALAACVLSFIAVQAARSEDAAASNLKIELEKTTVPEGGTLEGKLVGTWSDGKVSEEKLVLRLAWIDGAGRVVNHAEIHREKHATADEPIPFALAAKGGIGRMHRLVALVALRAKKKKKEEPQDWRIAAEAAFKIDRAAEMWDGYQVLAPGSVEPEHWKRLVALGVKGLAPLDPANGQNAERLAKMDLPFLEDGLIPPKFHAFEPANPEAWKEQAAKFAATRDPSAFGTSKIFDEDALNRAHQAAQEKLAAHAWLSPLGYSLGDAPALTRGGYPADAAADALTLDVFRGWLKERYGSLEKLNRHWGTTFPRWEEVRAPTTDEAKADADPRYAKLYEALRAGDKKEMLPRREGAAYFAFKLSELAPPGGEDYAAWCDWRAFQDFTFARMLGEYRSWVRAADSGARVGLTGTQGPSAWNGYDWSRIASSLDWCAPEGPDAALQRALYKSFNPGGRTLALLEAGPELRRGLWDGWLQGDRGALLEKTEKLFKRPSGDLTDLARGFEDDLRSLSVGLAEQRSHMHERRDGVAIYYSPRSLALHWMLDSRLDGSEWVRRGPEAADRDTGLLALRAWHALLMDLGYAPNFIEPKQLLAGKLGAKVLVLPKVLSLSDEEAAAIKAFANTGGVVIADSQCGVFDGMGKRREQPHRDDGVGATAGILDEAFGIRRTDFWAHEFNGAFHGDSEAARVILEAPDSTGTFGPVSSELRVNEPGVRATGAWRYGRTLEGIARRFNMSKVDGTAAMLIRPGGLGRFVYLNLAIQDYPKLREQAAADFALTGMTRAGYERLFGVPTGGEALRVLTGDMLFEALGEPALVVRAPDGTPLRGVARLLWTDGGAELIALLPPANEPRVVSKGYGFPHTTGDGAPGDGGFEYRPALDAKPAKPSDARVVLATKMHWYDARSGGYLGLGSECRANLDPDRATLLAALPYKVVALHTKVRRTNPQGAFKVWAELETGRAGAETDAKPMGHILRLEIYDPQGRHLPHYDANLYAEHGCWEGAIALALNEPAGNYRALFRDALTGASDEAHLLKEGEVYSRLFSPSLAEQRWTAEPSGVAGKLMLDGDGSLVYRRRVRMTATGQGLTAPPQFDVRAPKPWSFESFAFPEGRFKADNPTPEPYEVELVLKMRGRDLKPDAADGELVVKTSSGEERRALPFRVALVPQEEKGGIEIDGRLGDRGWGRAPQVAGFALKQDAKEDASAAVPAEATVVYLRRNETHLLIGVQCSDREFEAARTLKLRAEDRDDEALAQGDWFEAAVAVEGGKAEPVRVRIDPRGRVFDARGKDVGWNLSEEARCAAEMQKKGWSAEIAIPWKDLGLESAPDEGRGLRLGFERRRVISEKTSEQSVWRGDASRPTSDVDALGVAMTVGK